MTDPETRTEPDPEPSVPEAAATTPFPANPPGSQSTTNVIAQTLMTPDEESRLSSTAGLMPPCSSPRDDSATVLPSTEANDSASIPAPQMLTGMTPAVASAAPSVTASLSEDSAI